MRALFLGAHPDDVEVCAGGTVAKLVANGWEVVIATPYKNDVRYEEAVRAAAALGAVYWNWKVGLERRDVIIFCEGGQRPGWDLIVTPSPQDSHQEHREIAELGYALARKNNVELWHMNTGIPGGLAISPKLNHFMSLNNDQLRAKSDSIRAHKSQWEKYGGWDWLDTISARDRHYGGLIGAPYAEGYERIFSVG